MKSRKVRGDARNLASQTAFILDPESYFLLFF